MKVKFKVLIFVLFFSIIYLFTNGMIVKAHTNVLDVDYDPCTQSIFGDGDDEVWYYHSLSSSGKLNNVEYSFQLHYHISHNVNTITYFINNTAKEDSSYTWSTDISEDEALRIRNTYISSMLRWNDVYFYSYDEFGVRTSNKIINIVETNNRDSANIIIYPTSIPGSSTVASTAPTSTSDIIEQSLNTPSDPANYVHAHYDKWEMHVNISQYNESSSNYNILSEFTGQHEMGHVLGLRDVDNLCVYDFAHHSEILMGYGISTSIHTPHVSYKDIAGVSIIRGFHNDNNHIWMKRINNDNTIDLICAQCNGVLYDIEMDSNGTTYQGKSVNIYKNCLHHNGTASNMLLVATDGDRDFFKCQNCRHIETVDITGEYDMSNYSTTFNKIVSLNHNETKYYKIKINTNKCYEFIVNGVPSINFKLYDENFNEISYNDLDSASNKVRFANQFNVGTYYLECKFTNETSSGNISIQVNFKPDLITGNNNVVSQYLNDYYDYVYANNISAGFYKITLNATNSLGTIDYPEGCIKVYADEAKQQMLARLETIFYTLDAETQGDSNNVIVFLEYGESYYINIDLPSASYSSMYINIERLTNTYDIIESNNAEEHVILNENTTAYGDYIQRVEIHEAGTYTITFTHEGPQSEENLMGQEDPLYLYYAFYKEISSPAEQFGDLEMIFPHIASSWGGTISFTFNLQPGVYYIGYYNKLNNEPMTITISCN